MSYCHKTDVCLCIRDLRVRDTISLNSICCVSVGCISNFKWAASRQNQQNYRVRPAKTQISLGIHPVWSEFSLSAWRKLGSLATHWAHSEHWSDWADVQADLRWARRSFWWFCREAAHVLCFLGVYLLIQFILSCLVVLTVVVNLKVHHMGEQGRKMPRWAKRFTRKVLARLTCSKRSKVDVVESFDPNVGKLTSTKEHGKDNDMIFEKSKPTSPSMRDNDETDYSFEEVAMMLDTICLLVFCVLTFITTLTVLLTLASSDA